MFFLVKVRVNLKTMMEFGQKLQSGELDRSCIRGETYCLKNDPAVGYSVWESDDKDEFDNKFNSWKQYYEETEVLEVISPNEAMKTLFSKIQ
jgi:hypothetical protein